MISYIGPGLNGLAHSVWEMMQSREPRRVICAWMDEPGEIRWVLQRNEDQVHIRIFQFPNYSPNQEDEKGDLFWEAECSVLRLATQVLAQIQRTKRKFTDQTYLARWSGEFPYDSLEQLSRLITEHQHNSL